MQRSGNAVPVFPCNQDHSRHFRPLIATVPPLTTLAVIESRVITLTTASPSYSTAFATWFTVFVVAIGLWGIQGDYFPIPQDVRPSWYVYGWPICFGTCSRDRYGLDSFNALAALIDAIISLLMLTATFVTCRHVLTTNWNALHQLLAMVAGCAMLFFLFLGGLHVLLSLFKCFPPPPEISEVAGNSRPNQRLMSPPVLPGILAAVFSTGYSIWFCVAAFAEKMYSDVTQLEDTRIN